jgi:hypothetical protein
MLAVVIVATTVALITTSRLTTGFSHRGVQYLIMSIWPVAATAIPIIVGTDFVMNVFRSVVTGMRGDKREALRRVAITALADLLLLALSFAAALAVLKLAA